MIIVIILSIWLAFDWADATLSETHTHMHVNMSEKVHDNILITILQIKNKVQLMKIKTPTKTNKHKQTKEMHMISMWARNQFRVKQTVGPEYTNTSGDFSTGAMVVLHQMLPRGPTSTHRHNHVGIKIYSMLKIIITFSPSLLLQLLIHKHIRMHTQTHSNTAHTDMHKHIRADLNLPSVCVRTP